jgi:hypothetical protein
MDFSSDRAEEESVDVREICASETGERDAISLGGGRGAAERDGEFNAVPELLTRMTKTSLVPLPVRLKLPKAMAPDHPEK